MQPTAEKSLQILPINAAVFSGRVTSNHKLHDKGSCAGLLQAGLFSIMQTAVSGLTQQNCLTSITCPGLYIVHQSTMQTAFEGLQAAVSNENRAKLCTALHYAKLVPRVMCCTRHDIPDATFQSLFRDHAATEVTNVHTTRPHQSSTACTCSSFHTCKHMGMHARSSFWDVKTPHPSITTLRLCKAYTTVTFQRHLSGS